VIVKPGETCNRVDRDDVSTPPDNIPPSLERVFVNRTATMRDDLMQLLVMILTSRW